MEDNTIVRGDKGRFVQGTKPPNVIKSSADARMLAEKRWDKARKATASRILKEAQAIDPEVQDEYDAHALMLAMQFVKLADADKPNMDDAEKIAQAMGTLPRSAELKQQAQQQPPVQAIADAVSARLEDVFRDVIQRQVIEGTVTDSDG